MVSNNCGIELGFLAGKYAERFGEPVIGHLYGPSDQRGPFEGILHAYDNDVYACYKNGRPWPVKPWYRQLERAVRVKKMGMPAWMLAPDEVANRIATIALYEQYAPLIRRFGFRPAFALQDGMTFDDVPDQDCMLFMGGTTPWKEAAIEPWCRKFPGRVHVGRVTELDRLMACYRAGAVSIDGNGWWRKSNKPGQRVQRDALIWFFENVYEPRRAAA